MLEKLDLSLSLPKSEYQPIMDEIEIKIADLQQQVRQLKIPVVIVFEGWDAAGKGTLINRLLMALDARGFKVHPTNPPNTEEHLRPFLWRFWNKIPARGQIAIFDRSWYGRVLIERIDKIVGKKVWNLAFDEIKSFERQLVDDGYVIIKFFLHITKKEQKKRFKILEDNPATAWKVNKDDWRHHKQYQKYWAATEEMLAKTDTAFAPWITVEAHDRRFATVKIFTTVTKMIEQKIRGLQKQVPAKTEAATSESNVLSLASSVLAKADLTQEIPYEDYEKTLSQAQARIRELEHEVYLKRLPVVIVYEGWDAAGKGGNIRRLVQGMDPRGYEVIPFAAPNDEERAHHYLWRFWRQFPKAGHIAIFDRSWYGRLLVERVEGFCSAAEWQRAFQEINEMEAQFTNFGTVLIKFWIHIDQAEQLRRFETRQQTPHKQWKITEEDWRNRQKWNQYLVAVDEMLFRTSTSYSPWTIVEANSKLFARIKVLKTVIKMIEAKL